MQKVLRRTELAQAQAKRKARITEDKIAKRDRILYNKTYVNINRENNAAIRWARKTRREDYELGPLAPHRTAGKENIYGTFSTAVMQKPAVPKKFRIKDWFVRVGDRVCIVEGRAAVKGKIGKVTAVDKEAEVVTVEGLNLIETRLPQVLVEEGQDRTTSQEEPVHYSAVRLVYPLPDPTTGVPRDVIMNKLVKRDSYFDIYENEEVWSRYLQPQNLRIPWPEKEELEELDRDADTLRIDVEESSFLPTLLRPPMPLNIIDELRNKYSKFRVQHDDEWVAAKRKEDEEEAAKLAASKALIPKGARNIARTPVSTADGKFLSDRRQAPQLDDELLEQIGAHMAAQRGVKIASTIPVPPASLTEATAGPTIL